MAKGMSIAHEISWRPGVAVELACGRWARKHSKPANPNQRSFMDPIKLIKQDHRAVKALFRKFERAGKRSEKQKLGEEIIEELSVHAAIEEQLVYPAIRANKRMEESVLDAMEEHHAVKLLLAELDKMNVDDERYDAKMHVVTESVEMHIEEEEGRLLPALEKQLDSDKRQNLARQMVAMKDAGPNHPHPLAPDTPPAGMVAGAMAKVVDVGKDLVRGITNGDKEQGHRRVRARAKNTTSRAATRRGRSQTHRSA
jgi:hemerythrin superfamily protein